ncbi:MAG: trypsin-like peptidase domain-containing protein [candidate division KSB1 bacterium]
MKKYLLVLISSLQLWNCSSSQQSVAPHNSHIFSLKVQEALREVVPSVVGVAALFSYRHEIFNHQLRNGQFVPDSSSPTGFLLSPADKKSSNREQETQKVNGVGLVLYRDERRAVILTNAHIFLKPDTINSYYRDKTNRLGQVLQARAIKASANFFAIGQSNQFLAAEIIHADAKLDLALLAAAASPMLGVVFPFEPAYAHQLDWGDFAYVFGYPREVRQVTSGLVSKISNPGSFVLDVVARQGYSGGPVFVVHPEKGLQLVGVVRGVPVNKLSYVAPPAGLSAGQFLVPEDWPTSSAQEIDLIDYGTTYAISIEVIGKFLKSSEKLLERQGIILDAKFFPR